MPKVGKKHFKYDKAGRAKAARHAKATGQKVVSKQKKKSKKGY
jgi:hypothetical protein